MVDHYWPICGIDQSCDHGAIPMVTAKCPACGRRTLGLHGQIVQCDNNDCPDRVAAVKVLNQLSHRHIVEWRGDPDDPFGLEHPVTCRLDGKRLLDCTVHRLLAKFDLDELGTRQRGRFYIELDADSPWGFTTEEVPDAG